MGLGERNSRLIGELQPMAELELDDIQSGVLRPRPTPYVATYIALRIDDPKAGRALMKRASQVVTSAANPTSPLADTWASVAVITDKTGPTITATRYKVNALGVASNVNITSRVNAGTVAGGCVAFRLVSRSTAAHPPATAGGTDRLQQ